MGAKPARSEMTDAQSAIPAAMPKSPSPPSSPNCDCEEFEEPFAQPATPGEYAVHQSRGSFTALDCLLRDMEAGKKASDLEAPHRYRRSMVSLSDQSVVPARVSLRRLQGPQKVKMCDDLPAAIISDTGNSPSSTPASSPTGLVVGVDHSASCVSTSSSSVYSEQSSATTSTRAKERETPTSNIQARFLGSERISTDGIIPELPAPVDNHCSGSSATVLTQEPCRLSQTKNLSLRRPSFTLSTVTFLLDDSASDSKPSSPPSARTSNQFKLNLQDNDEASSQLTNSGGCEDTRDSKPVHPHAVNEKAAKLLGLPLASRSPKSPLPVKSATFQFRTPSRGSNEQSSSSPRTIKNLVSRVSLKAPKTSPSLMDSPVSVRISESSAREMESPSVLVKTLSARKKRPAVDAQTEGEKSDTNFKKTAGDAPTSTIHAKPTPDSPTRNAGSVSKRRGYRPLSVRIGEAFNPFSSKDSKVGRFDPMKKPENPREDSSPGLLGGRELPNKINWSENQDPHIFNANFVAALTSQPPPDIKIHPAFRADPFSVRNPEPLLKCPTSPKVGYVCQPPKGSESMTESQPSSNNSHDVDNIMVGLGLLRPQLTLSQTPASLQNQRRGVEPPNNSMAGQHGRSSPPFQDHPTQMCGRGQQDAPPSSTNHDSGKRNYGVPLSPSKSRFTSSTGSSKAQQAAQLPFPSGSFVVDDINEKHNRGFPNLFKIRSAARASGKGSGELTEEESSRRAIVQRERQAHIERLRIRLNAHSYDHDLADIQPRHPTTGRGWHSRNLKCTSCSDTVCSCCGRACCSFKACILTAEGAFTPEHIREAAINDITAINLCFPVGKESPTFIQCTHVTGCGKLVCPDCVGVCPDDCCQDVQCRMCKTHPWAKCDWHSNSDTSLADAARSKN